MNTTKETVQKSRIVSSLPYIKHNTDYERNKFVFKSGHIQPIMAYQNEKSFFWQYQD